MIKNQPNQPKIAKLLVQPRFARKYLLNALDSGSEQVFLEALHHIIDAIVDELEIDLIEDCPSTNLD
ncbi:MAG: hypothetical protein ACFCU5_17820 [Pleurocapsa sp.]